ncbi:hypothetical protein RJT34_29923 [Clitoria ternatea]|uniref:Pentatricopeptide repeat-containing protein n=1 Tax=Clitoria ternatea TaxID=43366 RepID=A0AAN9ESH8_CLITE
MMTLQLQTHCFPSKSFTHRHIHKHPLSTRNNIVFTAKRFAPEELCSVIAGQVNPIVCLELFHWASQQPRFPHDVSAFHVSIKKLGAAKMYQEMDDIVNQLLAVPSIGWEALFNTIIYYFIEARKLTRAVNVLNHMKISRNLNCCCRPSIKTYNILFAALLGRGNNSDINHVYMETIRCVFRKMVNDEVKTDIFSLNSMIKGYVLSLHVNDALGIFHQMGVGYDCQPNSLTSDYLIHGLCAPRRTNDAKESCYEMKAKGFIPSSESYNSLINSLAMGVDIEEAVNYLWEMTDKQRKLLYVLEDDYGNSMSGIDSGSAAIFYSFITIVGCFFSLIHYYNLKDTSASKPEYFTFDLIGMNLDDQIHYGLEMQEKLANENACGLASQYTPLFRNRVSNCLNSPILGISGCHGIMFLGFQSLNVVSFQVSYSKK